MAQAWLIRAKPNFTDRHQEFLDNGIAAIGWPGIGDLTDKPGEELKRILAKPPYNFSGQTLGSTHATVDLFVNRMQIGDLILMPNGDDIHFGEIQSDYIYDPSKDNPNDGYPHQRKVVWSEKTAARDQLSAELRGALKSPRMASQLSGHYAEVEALLTGRKNLFKSIDGTSFIDVTYPLRPNLMLSFSVPTDMTETEAHRLGLFFSSLYFTEPKGK